MCFEEIVGCEVVVWLFCRCTSSKLCVVFVVVAGGFCASFDRKVVVVVVVEDLYAVLEGTVESFVVVVVADSVVFVYSVQGEDCIVDNVPCCRWHFVDVVGRKVVCYKIIVEDHSRHKSCCCAVVAVIVVVVAVVVVVDDFVVGGKRMQRVGKQN